MPSHHDPLEQAIQRLLDEPPRPEHTTTSAFRAVAALAGDRLSPARLRWLLETQHRDGSWGGAITFLPDRCLNTLAAVVALTESDRAGATGGPDPLPAAHAGVSYLWNALAAVRWAEPRRLADFAGHLDALLQRARKLNLSLPYPDLNGLVAEPGKTLAPEDSSLCRGPAQELEALWTALTLARAGVPGVRLRGLVAPLRAEAAGAAADRTSTAAALVAGSPDLPAATADRTAATDRPAEADRPAAADGMAAALDRPAEADRAALVLALRRYCGLPLDPTLLPRLTSSEADPIHLLAALAGTPAQHPIALAAVLEQLRDQRLGGAYWQHRWHLSPYHATWLVLTAGAALDPDVLAEAVGWLVATQRADGSWGGTVEETAYAVSALLATAPEAAAVREVVAMGMDRIEAWRAGGDWPELWAGAVLFAPRRVVRAAVLGARYRYRAWVAQAGAEPRCTVSPASQ